MGTAGGEQWLAEWSSSVNARADAARRLAEQVQSMTSTGTAMDGLVRVTVGGNGQVVDVVIAERAGRVSMARVSAAVMTAMRRAQAGLVAGVRDAVDATVGADSETGRAVAASFAERFPDDGAASSSSGEQSPW